MKKKWIRLIWPENWMFFGIISFFFYEIKSFQWVVEWHVVRMCVVYLNGMYSYILFVFRSLVFDVWLGQTRSDKEAQIDWKSFVPKFSFFLDTGNVTKFDEYDKYSLRFINGYIYYFTEFKPIARMLTN